jgi:hypothetical protein
MIYSKLEGTTSKQFKLGKNGIQFQLRENDSNVLEIATPDGGLFVIGLSEVFNEAGQVTQPNAIPTAFQIRDYVSNEVEKLVGEDFDQLSEALNSISELVAAIGNDPNFFGNLTNIIGSDYLTSGGALSSSIPNVRDTSTNTLVPGTVSRRLTLGENNRVDKKFRNPDGTSYTRLSLTSSSTIPGTNIQTVALKPEINKTYRNNKTTYVYDAVTEQSSQVSLDEIRAMRPGVYTSNDGLIDVSEVNEKDYIFVHIDHAPNIGEE